VSIELVLVMPAAIVPMPASIVQVGVGDGGVTYVQLNATLVAWFGISGDGVAVKVARFGAAGGIEITVSRAVMPARFEQLSRNVVVAFSVTDVIWPFVTVPTP
jgi:hypothetical protein